ncbi:ECF transporter S component [Halanaerobaculum tunisiense]
MKQTKKLAINGLLIALVAVATMAIKIPVPATQGYIHPGDSMIYLAAILFGAEVGLIAGGVGSALADLLLGYPQFAIITLLVKGLEGWIIGYLAYREKPTTSLRGKDIIAALVGGSWMVAGYYLGEAALYKSFIAPLAEIPMNIGQAIGGAIIAFPIIYAILKTDLLESIKSN